MTAPENIELDKLRALSNKGFIVLLWLHVPGMFAVGAALGIGGTAPAVAATSFAAVATMTWRTAGNGLFTRLVIAASLISIIAIFLAEMSGHAWQLDVHMYFFVALALLSVFCDPPVLVFAGALITLHHAVLNFILPSAIYPGGADLGRVVLHGAVVTMETCALVWLAHTLGLLFRQSAEREAAKAAAESMRAQRDAAEAAARAKSEFLATMSHEIRSPMSGLVGVLDILRETTLDADQSRMVKMLGNSAVGLLGVLNDVLDFSKIEAGAMSINPEPVRLHDFVTELAQPHMMQAAGKGLGLSVGFGEGVPECVSVDPLRLRQILNNLLSNAIKFTPTGQIGLSVAATGGGTGGILRFAVRDSGIGMSSQVIARLFQPFMQADGSTTRDFGGTGLGLCICDRLARLLQGDLSVRSREGEGSVFTLQLPLLPACMPAAARSEPAAVAPAGAAANAAWRVLVVDDDLTNRWMSQRQLKQLGFTVDVAEDGQSALDILRTDPRDLVLTDCHMPRMDGATLTRELRASSDPALRDMPIVGVTADVTSAQRERCREAGMNELAIKPLTRQRLSAIIAPLLADRSRPGTMAALPPAAAARAAADYSDRFDPAIYRELFPPGDPEGEEWLTEYLNAADRLCAELERLLGDCVETTLRRDEIAATVHRLAGTSLSVGATRLGGRARELEHAATVESADALRMRWVELRFESGLARSSIESFMAETKLASAD